MKRFHITGVEIQKDAARCAMENAAQNNLTGLSVLHGDLREYRTLLPANGFDAVISNPPYYPLKSGAIADEAPLAIAKSELCCTVSDLCACAAWCLRFGGSFFLVHKPERLTDLLVTLRENRLEPKRLQFVRHHPGANRQPRSDRSKAWREARADARKRPSILYRLRRKDRRL